MRTLLTTPTAKVISILGFKLWIVKCSQPNWHVSVKSTTIGFFNYGIGFNQTTINYGLKNDLIK